MKTMITALGVLTLLLASCSGIDGDLLQSGINHKCDIAKYRLMVANDPENEELKAQLTDALANLETVIQSAPVGDRAALEAAIEEGACE